MYLPANQQQEVTSETKRSRRSRPPELKQKDEKNYSNEFGNRFVNELVQNSSNFIQVNEDLMHLFEYRSWLNWYVEEKEKSYFRNLFIHQFITMIHIVLIRSSRWVWVCV